MKRERTDKEKIALATGMISRYALALAEENAPPLPEQEPFAILINDIKKLKLNSFIRACVYHEYAGLILTGEPNEKQISECIEQLKAQYFDASGNNLSATSSKRRNQINTYRFYIYTVELLIRAIRIKYEPRFAEELKAWQFAYSFSRKTLKRDLKLVENELVGWRLKKEQLEKEEAESLANEDKAPQEVTEEHFLEQLAELRKFENYNTPVTRLAEEMTVYDYCLALKRFNEHLKHIQLQNANDNEQ